MKHKKVPGVPNQIKGGYHDTENKVTYPNSEDLEKSFNTAKKKLFDINNWSNYTSDVIAEFVLCDQEGIVVERDPQIGDYVKILLKAKPNPQKKDYIWVRIDMIDHSNPNSLMMQMRPSTLPGNQFGGNIMHFYSSGSTLTFIVSKGNNYVKAAVYGRNEKANTNTDLLSGIKNRLTALGARFGSQKIQWKTFTEMLLNNK
ncbi:hypothetical protein GSF70_16500 [Flavobacteriaceae bacterium W22]|nr:hypothetical protein [Flavobacteriaceae bacterium W22]